MDKIDLSSNNDTTNQILALAILSLSLVLGILSMFLFHNGILTILFATGTLGINFTLYSLFLLSSLIFLKKFAKQPISLPEYMLGGIALFFVITLLWRDSNVLNGLSLLSLILSFLLTFSLQTRQKKLQHLYLAETGQDLLESVSYSAKSYYQLLVQDILWNSLQQRWEVLGKALFRGLIMAISLLIVFGFLLTAADERFEAAVRNLFDWEWNWQKIGHYIATFVLCSWLAVAVLYSNLLNRKVMTPSPKKPFPTEATLGTVETVMALGALNLLFLAFIIVQFGYFFGGDTLVQSLDGLTYSDYARRGFFQLVAVALLVMLLLLTAHWLYQPKPGWQQRLFAWLAIAMILMSLVIEASAAHRMYVYTRQYGLTELRFYTSAFMIWLIILFFWFAVTVLREQRSHFAFGAILSGLICLGLLHAINPDAQIAKVNLARLEIGKEVDTNYLASLSADAVPILINKLSTLPPPQQCALWARLQERWLNPVITADWRQWHVARYQAYQSLLKMLAKSINNC
jgi:hypothetical protein